MKGASPRNSISLNEGAREKPSREVAELAETEQILLGSMIYNAEVWYRVAAIIGPEQFVEPVNGEIFSLIGRVIRAGKDPVPEELARHLPGQLGPGLPTKDYLNGLKSLAVDVREIVPVARFVRDGHLKLSVQRYAEKRLRDVASVKSARSQISESDRRLVSNRTKLRKAVESIVSAVCKRLPARALAKLAELDSPLGATDIDAVVGLYSIGYPEFVHDEDSLVARFEAEIKKRDFPRIYEIDHVYYWNIDNVRRYIALSGKKLNFEDGQTAGITGNPERGLPTKEPPKLPTTPPRLWPGRGRGRPSGQTSGETLIDFLRSTYGPYFEGSGDQLREYIFAHDKPLYQAIANFERRDTLPADVAMPSQRDRLKARLRKAVESYDELTQSERSSVRSKLSRSDRGIYKP